MRLLWLSIPLLVASTGCTSIAPGGTVTGAWGGTHVGLYLSSDGGILQYDCATGRIMGPMIAGADGRFVAIGSHTAGTGGPDRMGDVEPSWPARYSGSVRGNEMTLRVDVSEGELVIGRYRLRRGDEPKLMRCL